tara:strand:- start:175 stop:1098 length:924 start_codon:yes stop_codon:yes gene_type:complete
MNILYNKSELRFRAGFRIFGYIIVTIIFLIPIGLIEISWLAKVATSVSCLAVAYVAVRGFDNRKLSDIGLGISRVWWKEFFIGIIIAFTAQTLIFGIEFTFSWIEISGYGWERASSDLWIWAAFTYFLTMLSVGFYEELLFRGYIVRNLSEGFIIKKITPVQSTFLAVFLTSVFFGVAHAGNPNATLISTFNIVLAGLMLAIPYVLTGRLALSIGLHFSWNWVMGGLYGLPVSGLSNRQSIIQTSEIGPDIWTGGRFGPEAGLLGILGMAFILICILLYTKKINSGKLELHESFRSDYEKINPTSSL